TSHRHPPPLHSFPTRRSSDLPCLAARRLPTNLTPTPKRKEPMHPPKPLATDMPTLPCPKCQENILQQGFYNYCTETTSLREDNRSEEHTSELQSRSDLVCRLL